MERCSWATNPLLIEYHDNEYGQLTPSDNAIFEKICLESFSAGLSWLIVLKKREALREAFEGFSLEKCASLTDDALEEALCNPGIIRNTRKITAVRDNAKACLAIVREHGELKSFVSSFRTGKDLASAMRKYGVRQFGPVCAEELLKSLGLLPAHEPGCSFCNSDMSEASAKEDTACRHS